MQRVPGSASADLLIGLGLDRDDVISCLVREIGLNEREAAFAWETAVARIAADFPDRRIVAIDANVGV